MTTNKVTICIFAYNEEDRIIRCLQNFKNFAKIIVIDNYSTDATKEIVERLGIRCISIKNPNFIETPVVMNVVLEHVDTDYILIASVSEYVPLPLLQKYVDISNSVSFDVVRTFRVSITAGLPIPIAGIPRSGFDGELRFFRKGSVDYTGNMVHGRGVILSAPNRVLNLVIEPAYHFYQFRDYDCSHTETALCRYDDVLAKQRYDSGCRFSWHRTILYSTKAFLSSYFRFGSFRFGMLGFIHSYYRFQMEFTIWLRIWEWENGFTRSDVVIKNNSYRNKLESELSKKIA